MRREIEGSAKTNGKMSERDLILIIGEWPEDLRKGLEELVIQYWGMMVSL